MSAVLSVSPTIRLMADGKDFGSVLFTVNLEIGDDGSISLLESGPAPASTNDYEDGGTPAQDKVHTATPHAGRDDGSSRHAHKRRHAGADPADHSKHLRGKPHHGAALADHSRKQREAHQIAAAPASLKSANARESRAFWKSKGYSDHAIAGLLAQEASESNFQTHNVGDSGKAKGSFQWHADRRDLIKSKTGIDVYSENTSHADMLKAADWELHNSENKAGAKILGAKSAYEAGYAGSKFFERAGGKHGPEQEAQRRGKLAETMHHGGQKSLLSGNISTPKSNIASGSTPSNYDDIRGNANNASRLGMKPGENMTQIKTNSGMTATVNKKAAGAFTGFLNDLESSGYKISSLGGYNYRMKRGGSSLSQHAYGNAVDVNPMSNPFGSGKIKTDLPENVSEMAARHGLSWGGDWKGKKDPMHFEYTGIDPVADSEKK